MIVSPTNEKEWGVLARFLAEGAGIHPSMDLKLIGWVTEDQLRIVVGMHGFIGRMCQIHIANTPGFRYTPKELLYEVFNFAFNVQSRELLVGVVNSNYRNVLRYDQSMGFKELFRIPGMHDANGDVVILGMYRADCRFLNNKKLNGVRKAVAVEV